MSFCSGHVTNLKEDTIMKITLIIGVCLVFLTSCLTSAYESKPGVPKKSQY